jgi:hypothetical protein
LSSNPSATKKTSKKWKGAGLYLSKMSLASMTNKNEDSRMKEGKQRSTRTNCNRWSRA